MILVTSTSGGTRVELWCCVCRRLTLADSWVIFPPDAKAEEGRWVHRHCATDTQLRMLFGTKNITFMRGEDAIRRLLTSLDDRADPALARKRLRAVVKAKA